MDEVKEGCEFVGQQRKKQVQFSENLTTFIDISFVEVEKDCPKRRKRLFRRALSFGAYRKKPAQDILPFAHVVTSEDMPSPKPILKKRSHYDEDFNMDVAEHTNENADNDVNLISEQQDLSLKISNENVANLLMEQMLQEGEHLSSVYEELSPRDQSVLIENRKNICRNKPIRRTVKSAGQDPKSLLAKAGLVKEDCQQHKRELRKISCDCVTLQTSLDSPTNTRMVRSPTFPSSPTLIPAVRHTLADASNLIISDTNELRRANNSWFLPEDVMHDDIVNDENLLNLWLKEQEDYSYNIDNAIFGSVKYLKARNSRSRCMSSETRI